MSTKTSQADRCKICSHHRWAVDNIYLSKGSSAARDLCTQLGISQASFYRHIRGHLSLPVSTAPENPESLEWVRTTVNLASAIEAYRIVRRPENINDINIGTGADVDGPFIELLLMYVGSDSVDENAISAMGFEMGLDISFTEIIPGIRPTIEMSAKIRAEDIFLGRKSVKKNANDK